MGGPGSGNWYRWHKKTVVEDCLALDVNRLARNGGISRDHWISGTYGWTCTDTQERVASVNYDLIPSSSGPILQLRYTVSSPGGPGPVRVSVRLEEMSCHFGGSRWWFACPRCDRRAGKLHIPPEGELFACRKCHGLYYQVQRENVIWRTLRRAQRMRKRLGGDGSSDFLYSRPKGMHRLTFERRLREVYKADRQVEEVANAHFSAKVAIP
jgi:hypothetical protein